MSRQCKCIKGAALINVLVFKSVALLFVSIVKSVALLFRTLGKCYTKNSISIEKIGCKKARRDYLWKQKRNPNI